METYCDRCGIENPEEDHDCCQAIGRYCVRCGSAIRRRDGLCRACLDAHLDQIMPLADDLFVCPRGKER